MTDPRDPRQLPLFPLSNVALFPGIRAPLHVFEPRYRQMTAAAIHGDRTIGMIAVPPEHAGAMEGDPPLYPIGCVGVIKEAELLADGRYNMIVLGTSRFRIRSELPRTGGRLYRIAEVEVLDDPAGAEEAARVSTLQARVIDLFLRFVRLTAPERADEITPDVFEGSSPAALANTISHLLDFAVLEKQLLLEAHGVCERLDRLAGALEIRTAELGWPGGEGEPTRH